MSYPSVRPRPGEIVCFDFDGTLAEDTWPSPRLGDPIPEGVDMLRHFVEQGYAIIIHTARPPSHVPEIREWLKMHNIYDVYDVIGGKPGASLYVDDRAVQFSPTHESHCVKEVAKVPDGPCTCR